MKLFQYWDTGQPPAEVAGWIAGFAAMNPGLKHRVLDEADAAWFIRKHFGAREERAFRACAVPSMQSDYFRYCAVEALGGLYVDADFQCRAPLASLLERAPHALMLKWWGHVVGGFMMFRQPGDPFVRACRELTTENIEHRRFASAYTAAGPGVINAIRALLEPSALEEIRASFDNPDGRNWGFEELLEVAATRVAITPELRAAYERITVVHTLAVERWIGTEQPAYKQTGRHWLRWAGDIYRPAAPAA